MNKKRLNYPIANENNIVVQNYLGKKIVPSEKLNLPEKKNYLQHIPSSDK